MVQNTPNYTYYIATTHLSEIPDMDFFLFIHEFN